MHSKKSKKLNAETIEQFNKAQCGVLNTSKAADEGVDIAGVDTEIILHTDSSKIRKGQRLGRAVRFEEGKVAEIFTLIIAGTQETK
jgi:ERCC4-related helicase